VLGDLRQAIDALGLSGLAHAGAVVVPVSSALSGRVRVRIIARARGGGRTVVIGRGHLQLPSAAASLRVALTRRGKRILGGKHLGSLLLHGRFRTPAGPTTDTIELRRGALDP
jgi:hypothetical protein